MPAIDYRRTEQVEAAKEFKMTEILLHNSQVSLQPVLLPMIAQLSHQDRWLTLINPPRSLSRDLLTEAGANLRHIRVLKTEASSLEHLFSRTLSAGTSHTVIGWSNEQHALNADRLNPFACMGACLGVLVRG